MNNKEKNFISAVIYVHDALGRIEDFLTNVIDVFQNNFEKSEIICVNDASNDDSVAAIKRVAERTTEISITLINMSYFHGLEGAMSAGMDLAIGDFVFEFDTTVMDYDKSEIMKIYKRSLQGYDIVSASPEIKQRITSKVFYKVFDKFADISYKMNTESFRILSRRVINRISSMNKTVPYRKAVYANCGLKTVNEKYKIMADSQITKNKVEEKYRKKLAVDTLILFTDVGYKFSVAMTSVMMFVAIAMAMYSIVVFTTRTPVAGWTTTILFMAFAFFCLFGILTIVIKYLQIIVGLVFKRKRYSVESIEKITR